MEYLKRNHLKLAAIICLVAILAVCWKIGRLHENKKQAPPSEGSSLTTDFPYLSPTTTDRTIAFEASQTLNLNQEEDWFIDRGGVYTLTGHLEGTLYVRAEDENVHLILDGVTIRAKTGPAIWVESAGKVFITLAPDSENLVSDSSDYRHIVDADSCITANCDLTINGTGSLNIVGGYKDAISSTDVVRVLGGNLVVLSKRTGICGTDGIWIEGGQLQISSEKNGLRTVKSGADGKGALVVSGGKLNIIAGRYGFMCNRGDLYIFNCTIEEKTVVDIASVGGSTYIQEGCIQ